jgi:hypothetical protein
MLLTSLQSPHTRSTEAAPFKTALRTATGCPPDAARHDINAAEREYGEITYVSSIRNEPLLSRRCGRIRFSSSGA